MGYKTQPLVAEENTTTHDLEGVACL